MSLQSATPKLNYFFQFIMQLGYVWIYKTVLEAYSILRIGNMILLVHIISYQCNIWCTGKQFNPLKGRRGNYMRRTIFTFLITTMPLPSYIRPFNTFSAIFQSEFVTAFVHVCEWASILPDRACYWTWRVWKPEMSLAGHSTSEISLVHTRCWLTLKFERTFPCPESSFSFLKNHQQD